MDKSHYEMQGRDMPQLQRWQEVKCDIEFKIIAGKYQEGERIPSVVDMAAMYGVAAMTANGVMKKLAQENAVIMERGRGYWVKGGAREKLLMEHEKRLHDIFEQACGDAEKIGLDPIEMVRGIMRARGNGRS